MAVLNQVWCQNFSEHFSQSLNHLKGQPNIKFICANGGIVTWNGLPFLATMSHLFQARSGEEQDFTVHLPDYEGGLLKKLLILMTTGEVHFRDDELVELQGLIKDLGVS